MSRVRRDIMGREIKVGDYIVYAATGGRSGIMKVGKVTNVEKLSAVTVDIWMNNDGTGTLEIQNKGRPVSFSYDGRMMVIPQDSVNPRIREFLDVPFEERESRRKQLDALYKQSCELGDYKEWRDELNKERHYERKTE